MAKYIKAAQVDAKAAKKDKVDGYEVKYANGDVVWIKKETFEAEYTKL